MEERLIKAIMDYVKAEKTDYAYMIDGDWGIGKTYFIKNSLIESLKSINEEKYTIVYLSLNGMKSITDVKKKLFIELHQISGKAINFFNIGNKLLKMFDGTKIASDISETALDLCLNAANYKDLIIVMDDLERISVPLTYKEIFGFVFDDLIEKNNKVIFVSNESKIDHNDYSSEKEKVIRKTFKFDPAGINILEDLITNRYHGNYKDYLLTNTDHLEVFYNELKEKNLRTYSYALDNFRIIHDLTSENELSSMLDKLLITCMILGIEEKKGKFQNSDRLPSYYSDKDIIGFDYPDGTVYFLKNYKDYYFAYLHSKSMFNFFYTGFLDKKSIINELRDLNNEYNNYVEDIFIASEYIQLPQLLDVINKYQGYVDKDNYSLLQLIKLKDGLKSLSTIPEVSNLIKRCSSKIEEYFTSDDEFKWRVFKNELFSGKMINDYFPAEYKDIVPRKYSDYLLRKNKKNFEEILGKIDSEIIEWHQFKSRTFLESSLDFIINNQTDRVSINNMTLYNLKMLVQRMNNNEVKDKILLSDNLNKLIEFIDNEKKSSKDALFRINCNRCKKQIQNLTDTIK